jgi:N-acylneuraminate cytidylyltransferase
MSERVIIVPAYAAPGCGVSLLEPAGGRSLLRWTVDAALEAAGLDRVLVWSNESEILRWGGNIAGVQVDRVEGSKGAAGLPEYSLRARLSWLRTVHARIGNADVVVVLDPWAPVRERGDVDRAIQLLIESGADAATTARRIRGAVFGSGQSSREQMPGGVLVDPGAREGEWYEETGSIQVMRGTLFQVGEGFRALGHVIPVESGGAEGQRIENRRDLLEQDFQLRRGCRPGTPDLGAIRLLICDFDGVMTDNRVIVDQDGREAVLCHRGDGWGLGRLRGLSPEILVISTEANPVVGARCRKLKLGYLQNCEDKLKALQEEAERRGLAPEAIAYVGNDLNDLSCMQWVGLPIAVADAMPEILEIARRVTTRPGGFGAVREVVDWFVNRNSERK